MAEFLDLGKYCESESCKRIDFLPFLCTKCNKYFCLEHRTIHGCQDLDESRDLQPVKPAEQPEACHFCGHRSVYQVRCAHCNFNFCLAHRLAETHRCPHIPSPAHPAPPAPTQGTAKPLPAAQFPPPSGRKPSATAAKVRLMRLKQVAKGEGHIPQEERIYFTVQLPGPSLDPLPVFYNKTWAVGRAVDSVAAAHKLVNNNDKANARKLCLFPPESSDPLPMSAPLGTLELPLGCHLTLQYVDSQTSPR